jgi:hypothetical protein
MSIGLILKLGQHFFYKMFYRTAYRIFRENQIKIKVHLRTFIFILPADLSYQLLSKLKVTWYGTHFSLKFLTILNGRTSVKQRNLLKTTDKS